MNRRGFIYGLLVTPFAVLFARFKPLTSYRSRFATGGLIDGHSTLAGHGCRDCSHIYFPKGQALFDVGWRKNPDGSMTPLEVSLINPLPLTIADGESYQRDLARLKPLRPVPWERSEPRTFKYPLTGSIPWKPKDDDRA